jgi:hypothetical protein
MSGGAPQPMRGRYRRISCSTLPRRRRQPIVQPRFAGSGRDRDVHFGPQTAGKGGHPRFSSLDDRGTPPMIADGHAGDGPGGSSRPIRVFRDRAGPGRSEANLSLFSEERSPSRAGGGLPAGGAADSLREAPTVHGGRKEPSRARGPPSTGRRTTPSPSEKKSRCFADLDRPCFSACW